eukprot:535534-Amphidinium_carterae.1
MAKLNTTIFNKSSNINKLAAAKPRFAGDDNDDDIDDDNDDGDDDDDDEDDDDDDEPDRLHAPR